MQVMSVLKQIPQQFYNSCAGLNAKRLAVQAWSINHFRNVKNFLVETNLYKHKIEPLKKADYVRLTASAIVAVTVALLAFKTFVAIFPLVLAGSALLIFGNILYTKHRLEIHFNEIAWEHVNDIQKIVPQIDYNNHLFGDIAKPKNALEEPKFSHLKEDLKILNSEIQQFKNDLDSRPYFVAKIEDSKKKLIEYLESLKKKLASNKKDNATIPPTQPQTPPAASDPDLSIKIHEENSP